jgi:hypothetical protein
MALGAGPEFKPQYCKKKKVSYSLAWWLTPVNITTLEAQIRRIVI